MTALAISVIFLAISNIIMNLNISLLHKRFRALQRLLLAMLAQKIADDQGKEGAGEQS